MPWRLMLLILCISLALCFVGFNLQNTCTIAFFSKPFIVPSFMALFVAFLSGIIITIPFYLLGKKKNKPEKKVQTKKPGKEKESASSTQESGTFQKPEETDAIKNFNSTGK